MTWSLAIERHADLKLPDDDLMDIRHLGFRGEALPSIGAVARLRIDSRRQDADTAGPFRWMAGGFRPRAVFAREGNAGGSAGPVLCHPGAAEVPGRPTGPNSVPRWT